MKETHIDNLPEPIALSNLPALKHPLERGTFVGVIMLPDEKLYAVVLLDDKPTKRISWKKAMEWAASVGGQLPSRAIAALIFALAKDLLPQTWCWTNEPKDDDYAWFCYFNDGYQYDDPQDNEGGAVAVRLIPLIP